MSVPHARRVLLLARSLDVLTRSDLRVLVTECSFVPLHTSACSHRRVGTLVSRTDTLRVLVTECSFVPLHTSACSHPRVGTLVSRTDTLRVVCTSVPLQPADMLVLTRS